MIASPRKSKGLSSYMQEISLMTQGSRNRIGSCQGKLNSKRNKGRKQSHPDAGVGGNSSGWPRAFPTRFNILPFHRLRRQFKASKLKFNSLLALRGSLLFLCTKFPWRTCESLDPVCGGKAENRHCLRTHRPKQLLLQLGKHGTQGY